MISEAIKHLLENRDLDRDTARGAMQQIMGGQATDAQIGAYLIALRCKGETAEEIAGSAELMRQKATPVPTSRHPLVDTCGTGGDGSGTFNISTTVAFVAAGAGLAVAKHGNRAVSSQSGSADVLKELGVNIEADTATVGHCIDTAGIGFLFAPMLHGAMKHAIGPRREIGVRTIFNVLGPLTNPAGATRQLIGVYAPGLTETLAHVLKALGSERAFVVHGSDGLDEITLTGPTQVSELAPEGVLTYQISPEQFGLDRCSADDLVGGDATANAAILTEILAGSTGPRRDVVLLNAGAAITAGGLADDLADGIDLARQAIDNGKARQTLEDLKRVSHG
jgi:anthranilate phosphoribosyltransferase